MWFVFQGLIIAFGFLIFSQTFDGRLVAVKSFPTQISPVAVLQRAPLSNVGIRVMRGGGIIKRVRRSSVASKTARRFGNIVRFHRFHPLLRDHEPTKVVCMYTVSGISTRPIRLNCASPTKGALGHAREVRSRFVLARLWGGCGVHWISGRSA
jgi:hypothetical protein